MPHRESLGYKNHFNLDNLHEGEVVEVATERHVLHFLRTGSHVQVTDSFGQKLSEDAVEALGTDDDSEISMGEELTLPSQSIIEGERVILIRVLEDKKPSNGGQESEPTSRDWTSH